MKSILSTDYYVHFQNNAYGALENYLKDNFHSKIFILVDTNTKNQCLPHFSKALKVKFAYEVIEINAGEIHKNINTCVNLWHQLTSLGADRKSLLINLGGGVITDMGGFVASTFKRGIKFINIPTTLLSMVDASVGGKTGIDLGVLKNQVGLFSNPEMVMIDTHFLSTVPQREMRSGLAEIIKYGFTFDKNIWDKIKPLKDIDFQIINDLVYHSIEIKNEVVLKDLKEENIRKTLNFGHTIGHAFESYFLENEDKEALTHGEAIAIGMVIELYYSSKLFNFPMSHTNELKTFVNNFYGKADIKKSDFAPVIELMQFDKKNINGKVNFVLLNQLENCLIDVQVTDDLLLEGLEYFIK
ncbi:MAG: 3-dehydroquinate synthase [Flavobacteriaceae bacterium]|nr:3-dehydroquinate synthase [Flavobacteriaceae bacterium]